MPSLKFEKLTNGIVCGIDEAGRGPWAGPVVSAAVILPNRKPSGLNDSKKLTPQKREELFAKITNTCRFGIGIASVEEIDSLNILGATKLSMLRAYEALGVACDTALVDGNQLPALPCEMKYVVNGDSLSFSIAAASIIAKVTRDRILAELHEEFPHYNWVSNKGYGTPCHIRGLQSHGVTAHHRKSYAPIRKLLAA